MSTTVKELINVIGWKVDKSSLKTAEKTTAKFMKGLTKVGLAVGASIIAIGTLAIRAAIDMETLTTQFEIMLGSAEKAKEMVEDLTKFAAKTPFQLPDIALATRRLLSAGVAAKDIKKELKILGDLAATANIPLGDMASIFAKMKNKGKAMTEELLQMSDRGLPIMDALAEQFGVTKDQIFEMASKGKISFDVVTEALKTMTQQGGIANNGMEKLSLTTAGMISTMKDNITLLLAALGSKLLPTMKLVITKVTELFQGSLGQILEDLLSVVDPILKIVLKLAETILAGVMPLVKLLADLLVPLLNIVGILLEPVNEILRVFFEIINDIAGEMINALIPVFEELGGVLKELMPILMPIIRIMGKLMGFFIKGNLAPFILQIKVVAKVMSLILKLLQPIIKLLSFVLVPAFEFLEKVLGSIITFLEKMIDFVINGIVKAITFVLELLNLAIQQLNKLPFMKDDKIVPFDTNAIQDKMIKQDQSSKQINVNMRNNNNFNGVDSNKKGALKEEMRGAITTPFKQEILRVVQDL